MTLHTELQIHKVGVELLALAADVQAAVPRSYRNYGARITDECIDLLVAIARANAAKGGGRSQHIEHLLERLDVVAILFRVASAKQLISKKLWASSMQLTGSIGRQASHSHHDQARLARALLKRGHPVDGGMTKVFAAVKPRHQNPR